MKTSELKQIIREEIFNVMSQRLNESEENYQDIIEKYIQNDSEGNLDLSGTPIQSLPNNLKKVRGTLDLDNCKNLTSLPDGLYVRGNLYLENCKSLKSLPDGLEVEGPYLNLINCTNLTSLPNNFKFGGDLYLENCKSLKSLPDGLEVGGDLLLEGCTKLKSLPKNLKVRGSLWLQNTPLSENYTEEQIREMVPGIKGNINLYMGN
jgi:hypothetical protein